jgi:hypothetical protein
MKTSPTTGPADGVRRPRHLRRRNPSKTTETTLSTTRAKPNHGDRSSGLPQQQPIQGGMRTCPTIGSTDEDRRPRRPRWRKLAFRTPPPELSSLLRSPEPLLRSQTLENSKKQPRTPSSSFDQVDYFTKIKDFEVQRRAKLKNDTMASFCRSQKPKSPTGREHGSFHSSAEIKN